MNEATKVTSHPRTAQRDRVLLGATLLNADGSYPVRLRDMSRSGAHVVADFDLECGTDAVLVRPGVFAAAEVIWVRGNEAGLRFYRPQN